MDEESPVQPATEALLGEIYDRYDADALNRWQIRPGTFEVLEEIRRRGLKIGLVSTGQWLTVRDAAGKTATPRANAKLGTLFTVRGGPIKQDGLTWWELEGETIKGWAAEGDGQDRWLTPVDDRR